MNAFFRSLVSSPLNLLITLALLVGAAHLVPALWAWGVEKAVLSESTPEACRAAQGACWAVLHEKYRLILFGRYPYDEQARPALAVMVLFAALLATGWPRWWGRPLLLLWPAALTLALTLLRGGVAGLTVVPAYQWGGLPLTLLLAIIGILGALPLALALALWRRSTRFPLLQALAVAYIELVRSVPLISILFLATFLLPLFLPEKWAPSQLLRAQLAFILFTAAYLAEAIRGGLQGVPKGQWEACAALGLGYKSTMRRVILPQAFASVIPPMVGIFIGVFKDTSLVLIVGLLDLLMAAKTALADAPWRPFFLEVYLFVALLYFAICFPLSCISRRLEASVKPR
jgi:general L-amino acid transport system permease protein